MKKMRTTLGAAVVAAMAAMVAWGAPVERENRCVIYTDVNGLETTAGIEETVSTVRRLLSASAPNSDLDFVEQNPTVDLLICCDAGAMSALNNQRKTVESFTRETEDKMNMILHNNELDQHFKFRCTGCTALTTKFSSVQDGMSIKYGKGSNGIALALKEAVGADILVCVNGGGGEAIGLAYGVSTADQTAIAKWGKNAANPIASVYVGSAIGGYVTSHEVGHVMGAGHAREQGGPQGVPYAAGLHIEITNRLDVANASAPFTNYYYTVMAYNGARGSDGEKHVYTAIPYYTDPTKTYTPDPDVFDPVPVGEADYCDNARVLRDNCRSVASWRERVVPYDGDVRAYDAAGREIVHGRAFATSLQIRLESPVEGATIRYTLDGTTPRSDSASYTEPFTVTDTTTITACAVKDDKAYGLRTFKVMKLGVEPVMENTEIVWQTDTTYPWYQEEGVLRSTYAANSWLRAKITGPKRMTFYYTAKIGSDAQFDMWVNGTSQLRVTEDTTGFPSAIVDLPEGENDVVFFYRHGNYCENNRIQLQIASLIDIAADAAAVPVAKPVAVWNGDFVHNAVRGPATFNRNNNTIADDCSKVSRTGNGAIAFNLTGAGQNILVAAGATNLATGTKNAKGTEKAVVAIPTASHTNVDAGFGIKALSTALMRFNNGSNAVDLSNMFSRNGFHTFAFGATASGSLCWLDGKEIYNDGSYGLSGNANAVYIGAGGGGSFPIVSGDLNYIAIFTNATVSANDAKNWSLKNMTTPLTLSAGGDLGKETLTSATGLNLAGGAYELAVKKTVAALFVQGDSSIDFKSLTAELGGGQVLYVADGHTLTLNILLDEDELRDEIDAADGEWRHLLIKGANYGAVTPGIIPDLGEKYSLRIEQSDTEGVYLTGEKIGIAYVDSTVGGKANGDILGATTGNTTEYFQYGNTGVTVYDVSEIDGSIVGGFCLNASGTKVIMGNTSVSLNLASDAAGVFNGNIIGASLGGGCDCGTGEMNVISGTGTSSVTIDTPNSVTFGGIICGGGYIKLPLKAGVGLGMFGQAATNTVGMASSATIKGGTFTGSVVAGGYKEDDSYYSLYYANALVSTSATLTIAGGVFNGASILGGEATGTKTLAFTGRADLLGGTTISGFDTITIDEGVFVKVVDQVTIDCFSDFHETIAVYTDTDGTKYLCAPTTYTSAMSGSAKPTKLVEYSVAAGDEATVGSGETISAGTFIVNGTLTVAGTLEGGKIIGSGEVIFKGKTPDAIDWTEWSGLVTLSGVKNMSAFNPSPYGKVKLADCSGNIADGSYDNEIIFEDGNFGYAFNLTGTAAPAIFNNISGNGTIIDSADNAAMWVFTDTTKFTGSIKSDGGNAAFAFGSVAAATAASASLSSGTITVLADGKAMLGADKVWAPATAIAIKNGGVLELLGAVTLMAPVTLESGANIVFDDFSSEAYDTEAILSCAGGVSGNATISFGEDISALSANTKLVAWPETDTLPTLTPDGYALVLAAECQVEFSMEADGLYLRAIPFNNNESEAAGYYANSSDYDILYVVVTNSEKAVTIASNIGWAEFRDLNDEMELTVNYESIDNLEMRLKNCSWQTEYEKDGSIHTLDVKSAYKVAQQQQSGKTVFTLTLTGKNELDKDATVVVNGEEVKVVPELDMEGDLDISDTPTMTFNTIPGFWYEIVTTDDLNGDFTSVAGTRVKATDTTTTLTAPEKQDDESGIRFYKVRLSTK